MSTFKSADESLVDEEKEGQTNTHEHERGMDVLYAVTSAD
jgi:hypothetical protein